MHFYPHCISSHTAYIDEETKRSYMTYREMIDWTGLQTPPSTLLKMDVEGFEYDVLTQMLQDDYLLPLQHWATRMVDVPWDVTDSCYVSRTRSLFGNDVYIWRVSTCTSRWILYCLSGSIVWQGLVLASIAIVPHLIFTRNSRHCTLDLLRVDY